MQLAFDAGVYEGVSLTKSAAAPIASRLFNWFGRGVKPVHQVVSLAGQAAKGATREATQAGTAMVGSGGKSSPVGTLVANVAPGNRAITKHVAQVRARMPRARGAMTPETGVQGVMRKYSPAAAMRPDIQRARVLHNTQAASASVNPAIKAVRQPKAQAAVQRNRAAAAAQSQAAVPASPAAAVNPMAGKNPAEMLIPGAKAKVNAKPKATNTPEAAAAATPTGAKNPADMITGVGSKGARGAGGAEKGFDWGGAESWVRSHPVLTGLGAVGGLGALNAVTN